MIYNFNDFLFEKSSLTKLGVPNSVMKTIQEDFALSPDAEWIKIFKNHMMTKLKQGGDNLFIQLSIQYISVIFSTETIKGTKYYIDMFVLDGDEYTQLSREEIEIDLLHSNIQQGSNNYMLVGKFSIKDHNDRKIDKYQKENTDFVKNFKTDFIKNFDSILKRITNKNFNSAKEEIKEKARMIAYQNKMIIQNLDNPLVGGNGLNILDEFLYKFEDEYAEFFGERLDVQEMSDYFTRDKVLTMFMYYVYKGKMMK